MNSSIATRFSISIFRSRIFCVLFFFVGMHITADSQSDSKGGPWLGLHYQNGLCFRKLPNLFKKHMRKEGTAITSFNEFGIALGKTSNKNENAYFGLTADYAILNVNHSDKNAKDWNFGGFGSIALGRRYSILGNASLHFLDDYGKQVLNTKQLFEWGVSFKWYGGVKNGVNLMVDRAPLVGCRFGMIGKDFLLGFEIAYPIFGSSNFLWK